MLGSADTPLGAASRSKSIREKTDARENWRAPGSTAEPAQGQRVGMGQRTDPIQPERLPASGPARGPRRDTHNRPTTGKRPTLRTIHAVCRYPRKETRSPAHAAGSRMHHFRRAPPASTCSSVALALGGIRCRSAGRPRCPGNELPAAPASRSPTPPPPARRGRGIPRGGRGR